MHAKIHGATILGLTLPLPDGKEEEADGDEGMVLVASSVGLRTPSGKLAMSSRHSGFAIMPCASPILSTTQLSKLTCTPLLVTSNAFGEKLSCSSQRPSFATFVLIGSSNSCFLKASAISGHWKCVDPSSTT